MEADVNDSEKQKLKLKPDSLPVPAVTTSSRKIIEMICITKKAT